MGRAKRMVIGSRGDVVSILSLERVRAALKEAHPHAEFADFREVHRCGAAVKDASPATLVRGAGSGGSSERGAVLKKLNARKGSSAILQRLVKGEIDVAVIDAMRLPLQLQTPLGIVAILERTNPFDVLISYEDCILDEQPESTCIAASEPMKRGQLLYYRPDLKLVEGEDDFDYLFAEMKRGEISAFVFPASDVEALNKQEHVVEVFTTSICTPPAGQGALALVARLDRKDVLSMVRELNDPSSAAEIELERMFLEVVTKDGRGPVGVLGNVEENEFEMEAAIAAPDGSERLSGTVSGALADRAKILGKLAGDLLAAGGEDIIASYRKPRGGC